jgi:hypothetical protein
MMRLRPEETDLLGRWVVVNGKVVGDETTERIEWLVSNYLEKVAVKGGWDTLYKDPQDGRYWEHIYPESHMHGGGPPRLMYLSHEQVAERYGEIID